MSSELLPFQFMDMVLINCRSVKKNGHKLQDLCGGENSDMAAITEAWLTSDNSKTIEYLCPEGKCNINHE